MNNKKEIKKKLEKRFDKKSNYIDILNNMQKKKIMSPKFLITAVSFVLIFVTSIYVVYAKEVNQIVRSYFYKYESKEKWINKPGYGVSKDSTGVYSVHINGIVTIKKNNEQKDSIKTLSEAEDLFGIKLLKSDKVEYKYLDIFSTGSDGRVFNKLISDPAIVRLKLSNFEDFDCNKFIYHITKPNSKEEIKKHKECTKEMYENEPKKRLDMQIIFATGNATKNQLDDFVFHMANFPGKDVQIHYSKTINTEIFISGNNKYLFVNEHIAYLLDNYSGDYTKEEILNIVESML